MNNGFLLCSSMREHCFDLGKMGQVDNYGFQAYYITGTPEENDHK